jgi:hypothetical protein
MVTIPKLMDPLQIALAIGAPPLSAHPTRACTGEAAFSTTPHGISTGFST